MSNEVPARDKLATTLRTAGVELSADPSLAEMAAALVDLGHAATAQAEAEHGDA